MNDLAAAYVISRQYAEGIKHYEAAIDTAERMTDMDESLVAFYYNCAEVTNLWLLQTTFFIWGESWNLHGVIFFTPSGA